ncbi:MAG TPA: S-methyl-5'-thioadenosine phosphorylase [Candidatus Dormibacteraeota bacterium]|jgi:5'-methylthioadenosine phosphorylase|nr:S-methyl-5'-thioadenosine phosphorylase [Candidatus Dormibacteraeota bacterium]
MSTTATLGVFGGSGFYRLLDDVELLRMDTPFGPPSDEIAVGRVGGAGVAFLPRHGARHTLPPGAINYRANLWAMRELGVTRIIAPTAAGSLRPDLPPGAFVVCDQFIDRTWGRRDTYYPAGPTVAHASAADPYCPQLRRLALDCGRELGLAMRDGGTVVVIQGPRFASRAESRWYRSLGAEVINMTQYPELILARELELCYVNISLITDYDAGVERDPSVAPVSADEVTEVFEANLARLRGLILRMAERMPPERECPCSQAMAQAVVGGERRAPEDQLEAGPPPPA